MMRKGVLRESKKYHVLCIGVRFFEVFYFICVFFLFREIKNIHIINPGKLVLCLFILYFVVQFILLAFHETSHAIAFSITGVRVRAVYVSALLFYYNRGIRCKFFRRNWGSGMVLPDIPKCRDKEEFERFREAQLFSLASGLMGTMLTSLIIVIILFIIQTQAECENIKFIIMMNILFTCLHSFSILHKSFCQDSVLGDGDMYACKQILNDEFYLLQYIYSQLILSTEFVEKLIISRYLKDGIAEHICKAEDIMTDSVVYVFDDILLYTLAGVESYFDDLVYEQLENLKERVHELVLRQEEIYQILFYHIVLSYILIFRQKKFARELLEFGKMNMKIHNSRVNDYYISLVEVALGDSASEWQLINIYPYRDYQLYRCISAAEHIEAAVYERCKNQ